MSQILLKKDDPATAYGTWGIRGSKGVITAWNGGAFDGCAWHFIGGGHLAYGGNEVYRFELATQRWDRLTDPTPYLPATADKPCPGIADKSRPVPAHNYDGLIYSPVTKTIFLWSLGSYCDELNTFAGALANDYSTGRSQLWEFNPVDLSWRWHDRKPPQTWYSPKTAVESDTGRIVYCRSRICWLFDPVNGTYSAPSPLANFSKRTGFGSGAFDDKRKQMVMAGNDRFYAASITPKGVGQIRVVGKTTDLGNLDRFGIAYDRNRDVFALWAGDRDVYRLDPVDWRLFREKTDAQSVPVSDTEGVYGRWAYADALDAFIGLDNVDQGIWLYRLSDQRGEEIFLTSDKPCSADSPCKIPGK